MNRRLEELQAQRALLVQHLEWLEKEIATEQVSEAAALPLPAESSLVAPPTPDLPLPLPATVPSPAAVVTDSDAEALLNHYRQEAVSVKSEVRRGCLIYVLLASLVIGLFLLAVWAWSRSRRAASPETANPTSLRQTFLEPRQGSSV